MSDTFEELRIIAQDACGLPAADRDIMRRAADELEQAWRTLLATQAALIESQGARIALNERLLEMVRKPKALLSHPLSLQLYAGPIAGKWMAP